MSRRILYALAMCCWLTGAWLGTRPQRPIVAWAELADGITILALGCLLIAQLAREANPPVPLSTNPPGPLWYDPNDPNLTQPMLYPHDAPTVIINRPGWPRLIIDPSGSYPPKLPDTYP